MPSSLSETMNDAASYAPRVLGSFRSTSNTTKVPTTFDSTFSSQVSSIEFLACFMVICLLCCFQGRCLHRKVRRRAEHAPRVLNPDRKRGYIKSRRHTCAVMWQRTNTSNRILCRISALAVLLSLSVISALALLSHRPKLLFDANNSFKILHLTDLHLAEEPLTARGPAKDNKTYLLVERLIRLEEPDLIVLGGDQLNADNVDVNATAYYDKLANIIEQFSIPYALIFGNHDDMALHIPFPNGTMTSHRAKTSRQTLVRSTSKHRHSLTQLGPSKLSGVSNYMLDVKHNNQVKLQIALLDSGGGSIWEGITASQMEWYRSQRLSMVDAILFQHMPTKQFKFSAESCIGHQGQSAVSPMQHDPMNEVPFLLKHDTRLHFMAVGHNHGNGYCCPSSNSSLLHVCFGRRSGYGGYGESSWLKGARVFQIRLTEGEGIKWKSWVRLETDKVTDRYEP